MAKILIAEDERDIRDLIAFTLKFAGYDVVTANNGEEAVQLAKQELPDLVITDVRMPKMTGYEACKLIKADPTTAHIPVVFLSAKGQEAEVQTGLDSGADEYLLKPFAPDQLTRKVADILAAAKRKSS
jgi:two-component system alkaline phosphatase synthesis response regulator PhoP